MSDTLAIASQEKSTAKDVINELLLIEDNSSIATILREIIVSNFKRNVKVVEDKNHLRDLLNDITKNKTSTINEVLIDVWLKGIIIGDLVMEGVNLVDGIDIARFIIMKSTCDVYVYSTGTVEREIITRLGTLRNRVNFLEKNNFVSFGGDQEIVKKFEGLFVKREKTIVQHIVNVKSFMESFQRPYSQYLVEKLYAREKLFTQRDLFNLNKTLITDLLYEDQRFELATTADPDLKLLKNKEFNAADDEIKIELVLNKKSRFEEVIIYESRTDFKRYNLTAETKQLLSLLRNNKKDEFSSKMIKTGISLNLIVDIIDEKITESKAIKKALKIPNYRLEFVKMLFSAYLDIGLSEATIYKKMKPWNDHTEFPEIIDVLEGRLEEILEEDEEAKISLISELGNEAHRHYEIIDYSILKDQGVSIIGSYFEYVAFNPAEGGISAIYIQPKDKYTLPSTFAK